MNEANGPMSEFETWLKRFRGVSSRHLQGCVDRSLFQKALSYAKETLGRPGAELSAILCREVFEKAVLFDLKEAYGKWHYGIFADGGIGRKLQR